MNINRQAHQRLEFLFVALLSLWPTILVAESDDVEGGKHVETVAKAARDSIVVVSTSDRTGEDGGIMGTGFAIDHDLIVTNLHVIGEALPIRVTTRAGKQLDVTEVYASDANMDLAVLRVANEQDFPKLPLAQGSLELGQQVVALGHPLGLEHTVLSGRVAGEQKNAGTSLWQLEMTIERGSSGGPVLDLDGSVHGIISMKSTTKERFGFAIKLDHLKSLLASPNPIPMDQWQTIGLVDPERWEPLMGARWRQKSGKVSVAGAGEGFGGRSLLLRKDKTPKVPFELAVAVKMDDESGAAGLVFHSDREMKHYGFYPSNGRIRLTSFEGPDPFSWNIIQEIESEHYRPGDWNELKVRVSKDEIIGSLNGREITRIQNVRQPPGAIGLCKFRNTKAQFKAFRFGPTVPSRYASSEKAAILTKQLESLNHRSSLLDIDLLGQTSDVWQRMDLLEAKAKDLEQQAKTLRRLASDIHTASVCSELEKLVAIDDDQAMDLLRGALLISRLDNPELVIDEYLELVEEMTEKVRREFTDAMPNSEKISKLNDYLFRQNRFHGSRLYYYSEVNSYVDRVLDDREGIPVTLSVIYISIAKRLGLDVVGVGLPGHFVVRHEDGGPDNSENHQLIDVFSQGTLISKPEAKAIAFRSAGYLPTDAAFATSSNRSILVRMLVNLSGGARDDPEAMLRYMEGLVALEPDEAHWRRFRAVARHQNGRKLAALDDIDWLLEKKPAGMNLVEIRRMREFFAE